MAFSDARLMLCLGRVQAVEGTLLAPAVGTGGNYANELLVQDQVRTLKPDRRTSQFRFARASHTPSKPDPGRTKCNLEFPTKLMWRGNTGGPPWLDVFFRSAGWKRTDSVASGKNISTYTPLSFGKEVATFDSFEGAAPGSIGKRLRSFDARGKFAIEFTPEQTPSFIWTGAGKWVDPVDDVVTPTPIFPTDTKAIAENMLFTIGGGFTPSIDMISFDSGEDLQELGDLNADKGYLREHAAGRDAMSLKVRFREENNLDKDFFAYMEAQDNFTYLEMDDVTFQHGDDVEHSIMFDFPSPYLMGAPEFGVDKGIRTMTLNYLPVGEDDAEVSIAFREDNGS